MHPSTRPLRTRFTWQVTASSFMRGSRRSRPRSTARDVRLKPEESGREEDTRKRGELGALAGWICPGRRQGQRPRRESSFKVEVSPDGMARTRARKDFHDTLTFADGTLVTSEGPKLGFQSAPYTMSRSGDKDWNFTAEQASDAQGNYVWSGTVHEGESEGQARVDQDRRYGLEPTRSGRQEGLTSPRGGRWSACRGRAAV